MSKKLVLIDELLRHIKIKGFSLKNMETILKVKRQEEIKQLTLTDVVKSDSELLRFMEHLSTYHGIDEVIDCTKHQQIIEQYKS